MYSYDERMAAVKLYILYENPHRVKKELGYPSSPVTVYRWYNEFKKNGRLHKRYAGPEYYSEEEKRIAIEHYKNNGRNIQHTIATLGYPSAKALGMSKKGCSPDNSACEGFFGRLKVEMFYGREWADVSIPDFIDKLDEYMHWYGEKRIKMSLGGMSPLSYRKNLGLIA